MNQERVRQLFWEAQNLLGDIVVVIDMGAEPEQLGVLKDRAHAINVELSELHATVSEMGLRPSIPFVRRFSA